MESYDQAKNDIVMLRNYFPDDQEINLLAAKIFRESGEALESLKILNTLLKNDNSQPDYYIERAKTFSRTGNHKFAEADFGMALDLDATNAEAYYLKGIERLKIGDKEGACIDFKKAKMFGEMRAVKELIQNNCN
jgi:Flp pilus assembly protein TadD